MAFPPLRPTVAALLAAGLIAGCAAAGTATAAGGRARRRTATAAGGRAPARTPPTLGSRTPSGTVPAAGVRSRAGAGCASWPSGSTRTVLLITAASDGRTYCVRTGQTVRVQLSGSRPSPPDRSRPGSSETRWRPSGGTCPRCPRCRTWPCTRARRPSSSSGCRAVRPGPARTRPPRGSARWPARGHPGRRAVRNRAGPAGLDHRALTRPTRPGERVLVSDSAGKGSDLVGGRTGKCLRALHRHGEGQDVRLHGRPSRWSATSARRTRTRPRPCTDRPGTACRSGQPPRDAVPAGGAGMRDWAGE